LIVLHCWRSGIAGKITAVLLSAAWIFASGELALAVACAAVLSSLLGSRLRAAEGRWILGGACGVLLIALIFRIASNLLFTNSFYADPQTPLLIRQAGDLAREGGIPFSLCLLVVMLASRSRATAGIVLLGIVGVTGCLLLLPETVARWSQQQFSPGLHASFAPWRALIPPGRDVFWSESPAQSWILLERPSYLSEAQTSGGLFSRPAAIEMQRRAVALSTVVPPAAFWGFSGSGVGLGPSPEQLERACASGAFEYLVSGARLPWAPLSRLPKETWHSSGGLGLYRCSDRPRI
jgi:hypothetical protein